MTVGKWKSVKSTQSSSMEKIKQVKTLPTFPRTKGPILNGKNSSGHNKKNEKRKTVWNPKQA